MATLAAGKALYTSDEPASQVFVLLRGRLAAWRADPSGRCSALYFIADEPGTVLCVENVLSDIPFFATMRAMDEATVALCLPAIVLNELLDAHPQVGVARQS